MKKVRNWNIGIVSVNRYSLFDFSICMKKLLKAAKGNDKIRIFNISVTSIKALTSIINNIQYSLN